MRSNEELKKLGKLDLILALADELRREHPNESLEFMAGFAMSFFERAGYERESID